MVEEARRYLELFSVLNAISQWRLPLVLNMVQVAKDVGAAFKSAPTAE
jgi:hypothetical protein